MAKRTIQSPGVEIRESDLSLRTAQTGTTTYITGFASEGPIDEVVGLGNISEFEQIYGTPKTPVERYFYHTARAALNSSGRLLVNRLPYGEANGAGFGSKISVLAYPAVVWDRLTNGGEITTTFSASSATTYVLGRPTQFEISQAQYIKLKNGSLFDFSNTSKLSFAHVGELSGAAVIVVNKGQSTIDDLFSGYYVGLADNTNMNPARDFDAIGSVLTTTASASDILSATHITIPASRFEFSLTATPEFGDNPATNSISQVMEDRITDYNLATRDFDDTLNVGVFKLRQSVFSKSANQLNYILEEGYNGSIGYYRQRNAENGGAAVNFSLEQVEDQSRNIDIIVNPNVSDQITGIQLNDDGTPTRKIRVYTQALSANLANGNVLSGDAGLPVNFFYNYLSAAAYNDFDFADNLMPIGSYGGVSLKGKVLGSIPGKIDRALDLVRNDRKFDIDIIAEGGLGTVHTYITTATNPPHTSVIAGEFAIGTAYTITSTGTTDFTLIGAGDSVTSGAFVDGTVYTIITPGTTDFTLIGAADSNVGTTFTATDVGTGTGTAGTFAVGTTFTATDVGTGTGTATVANVNVFDDTKTTKAIEALRTSGELSVAGQTARTAYNTIFGKFATFAGPAKDGGRGDIIFIADPIRQLLVTGKNNKIQKDPARNFYVDVYWPLRHQFSLANTSYATVFANWMRVYDNYTGLYVYVPSSGFGAAKMASTDAQVGPWGAPAGFNRGIILDADDIAISPNQRQRDDLYSVNLNPIANFADQGNVIFGQKTLLKQPSAFDRINVRRTFLYLEKITKKTMQFFLFENNTLFTRTRVINTLKPFFERVKADDGLYDYMIVCDERNNTGEVIDQNELVVDIYLKPVRTAEFILVNFYATRTDANFEELIGG